MGRYSSWRRNMATRMEREGTETGPSAKSRGLKTFLTDRAKSLVAHLRIRRTRSGRSNANYPTDGELGYGKEDR